MTSPAVVRYDISCFLSTDPDDAQLDVTNIVATMDMDADAYCSVDVTLASVTDATWVLLDPRNIGVANTLYFSVDQYAVDDSTPLTSLPVVDASFDQHARMYLRTAEIDDVTGEVTIRATSGEPMLSDRRRVSTTTLNTGATDVEDLLYYSLYDIFGSVATQVDPVVGSTSIPAGDRRLFLQGETHTDLILPELQAIDCRLYDYWGRLWAAKARDTPPTYVGAPTSIKLATHTEAEGAPSDADPIVYTVNRTMTREGDWADGVVVHGRYVNGSGTTVEWWQRSGTGANTRGRVIDMDRAQPAGNIADKIVQRTVIRGAEMTVTAAIRFDVRPGQELTVYTKRGPITANIRAVTWDIAANEMTIRAETGDPL